MGKRCIEEFNPWPPFVDIFASVILVMLLFMLILLVNLGYYAQFKFKLTYSGEESKEVLEKTVVSTKQKEIPVESNTTSNIDPRMISLFEGAKNLNEGNSISREKSDDKSYSKQKIEESEHEFVIKYQDKEMFAKNIVINQLSTFMGKNLKKGRIKSVKITVSDPIHVASRTVAKQISLGRVLDIKNKINRLGVEKNMINIDLQTKSKLKHQFGFVTVKVIK